MSYLVRQNRKEIVVKYVAFICLYIFLVFMFNVSSASILKRKRRHAEFRMLWYHLLCSIVGSYTNTQMYTHKHTCTHITHTKIFSSFFLLLASKWHNVTNLVISFIYHISTHSSTPIFYLSVHAMRRRRFNTMFYMSVQNCFTVLCVVYCLSNSNNL